MTFMQQYYYFCVFCVLNVCFYFSKVLHIGWFREHAYRHRNPGMTLVVCIAPLLIPFHFAFGILISSDV